MQKSRYTVLQFCGTPQNLRMTKVLGHALLVSSSMVLFAIAARAQKITATLRGDITDNSGGAVAGAKVLARNQATNAKRETVANDQGSYVIDLLPPGRYDVSIEHPGFNKRIFSGVEAQV